MHLAVTQSVLSPLFVHSFLWDVLKLWQKAGANCQRHQMQLNGGIKYFCILNNLQIGLTASANERVIVI